MASCQVTTPINTPNHTIIDAPIITCPTSPDHHHCAIEEEDKKRNFCVRESRLLFAGGISLIVVSGGVAVILLNYSCAVNNAAFGMVGTVVGGWISLLTMKTGKD
jgi:hypothetical protein